jgi:hypothetical protein
MGGRKTAKKPDRFVRSSRRLDVKGSFVKLRLSDIQSVNRRKMTFPTRLSVTLIQRRHVIMKNLFDAAMANQVKTRLGKLEPQSERRWGKMTAAQMLAHCSVSMQWAGQRSRWHAKFLPPHARHGCRSQ